MKQHAPDSSRKRIPGILLIFLITLLSGILVLTRCANIVSPDGGPRDTIPPFLVSADPPDSSLRFHASKITLGFSEFVQLAQNYNNILIIAPGMNRQPQIKVHLRDITITLADSLKPHTTYQINFGNSIQDITEANAMNHFRYVFSTGTYLDSLEVGGRVLEARTGLADSNVEVMLYTDLRDSVVRQEKPLYYTRTDPKGNFLISNLPRGIFKLFALKENNGTLQYDQPGEQIAFADQPLVLDSSHHHIHLYLFRERPAKVSPKLPGPISPASAKLSQASPKLGYSLSLSGGLQELDQPLEIRFTRGVRVPDSSRMVLLEDSIPTRKPLGLSLDDSSARILSLNYPWKEDQPYRLLLQPGFVKDSAGSQAPGDTVNFRTKRLSDYGSVTLQFQGLDTSVPYMVQIISNGKIVRAASLLGYTWHQEFFIPGNYQIRLLKDDNHNGVWDTGRYFGKKRQPEIVQAVPGQLVVRSNWENRLDINLKSLPAP